MLTTETLLGLGGLLLAIATTVAWFWRANQVAIPDNRLVFLLSWACAALLGVASLVGPGANWLDYIFGGLAMLGGLFMLVLYMLGGQKVGSPIMVGDTVPVFAAPDDQGQTYSSDALMGTPTLIKFFRGHW